MARTVGIGIQDFETVIVNDCFYVDKTKFIKEWWESNDSVTLIARPRRFGKTLTMSMLEKFFSVKYAGREDLFEGLSIWQERSPSGEYKYRKLQGTYPVISLSFANIKENNFQSAREKICQLFTDLYVQNFFLRDSDVLTDKDRDYFDRISADMRDSDATMALNKLSDFMCRYYGKKVILLLDEYDTPMQEAYIGGYWGELVQLFRGLFNSAFKTNPYLERAVMTGITRISKESIFSDLNNLEVVTATSDKYADVFGFTEREVFTAMDEMGLQEKEEVKRWYDGFNFGKEKDIYNPWSIINFLNKQRIAPYWVNSSSNDLVGKLLKEADGEVKEKMERLLKGESITSEIDEEIVYSQLGNKQDAIWGLLLAGGYLKVLRFEDHGQFQTLKRRRPKYELSLTNLEVHYMFEDMISGWFGEDSCNYNDFIKALLLGDVKAMNTYMNRVALNTFSYFDTGNVPSAAEPERFYHGFVLGLLVDMADRYVLTSNRESGFGRYDVVLEPLNEGDDGIIIEFKVHDPEDEETLQDTVQSALKQIEEKKYSQELKKRGVSEERIRKYGFAFEGDSILIG